MIDKQFVLTEYIKGNERGELRKWIMNMLLKVPHRFSEKGGNEKPLSF